MKRPGDGERAARDAVLGTAAAGVITLADLELKEFGRYEVVASIGKGGMGEIYLARRRDKRNAKLVALKVLVADTENDDDLVAMFMDEAAIMAQIHHPNVLEVSDFGVEDGRYYLAMEYLAGRPLVRVMIDAYAKDHGFDLGVLSWITANAARGLDAAHAAVGKNGQALQVVHRDVSPQNVFVTYAGVSKVIDFGVARASERIAQTTAGQLKGKAAYMSPEQVQGQIVDRRSDVFSLGICLWEMSAGRRLFKRDNEWETMSAVVSGPIVAPSKVRGLGDPMLDQIVLKSLERSPDKRFQNAGEMAQRLEAFVKRRGGGDPTQQVVTLLDRLYGSEAKQERALIADFERRAAKADEIDALRQLSGISLRPSTMREITLAGTPEALADLDQFGVEPTDPGPDARIREPIHSDEISNRTTGPEAVQRAVARLVEQRSGGQRKSGTWGGLADVGARAWMAGIALVVVSTILTVVVVSALRKPRSTAPIAPVPEQVAASPAPVEAAPVAVHIEPIAVEIKLTDDPAPSAVPASSTLASILAELERHGLKVAPDGDAMAIIAGADKVLVGGDARVEAVTAGEVRGYLVTTRYPGAPAATWVGGAAGAWKLRPLSVNDCPAEARPQPFGIELQYEKSYRFLVPYSGGTFARVTVTRPDFAERAELMPFGVAFGRSRPDRAALVCTVGWTPTEVRLERLPPGAYQLVWMGGTRTDTQEVVVSAQGVATVGPLAPR